MYRKKVLFVITKSNWGGAQRYVYDLATALPREHFEPVVALGGVGSKAAEPGLLKERLESAGIRVIVVRHFLRNMALLSDALALFEVLRLVWREKPDVLHVTSSKAGGIGAFVGRVCGVQRIVFTSHGLTFDEVWRPRWQRMLIWFFTWWTIILATDCIQISKETYTRAAAMPFVRKKVHLVYNGIRTPAFRTKDEARHTLLPSTTPAVYDRVWIGTIAEYHPNKNLDTLIEAFAQLVENGTDAELVLIGEGEERESLATLTRTRGVEHRVHLAGYIDNAATLLPALNVFVLPSKKEGLPYVLLEAGLAGLPVVVSAISGNTDIIEDKKTGRAVQSDPRVLAHTVHELLKDPATALRYATALKTKVEAEFSIAHMAQETFAFYAPANPSNS